MLGAGPCGLTAVKNLLQQGLTSMTVFEKNKQLGGNWLFSEENDHSSVYETTHSISSKHLSAYEDFPMPDDYPDYPSHTQLLAYFNAYADHFEIKPFIKFNTCVLSVTPRSNHQWLVTYQDEHGQHDELFDHILVANGHHNAPLIPHYSGDFQGDILHSHHYKKASPFKDKRVLVVGGGNSACDIAVEVARIASKTSISMRNAQHVFPKFIFGKPTDVAFSQIHWLPFWCRQYIAKWTLRILQGRYAKYHLKKPTHKPLTTHPTINSELLYFIRHGKVSTRDEIKCFDGTQVCFSDNQKETFDTIIFATGYNIQFPFFPQELIDYQKSTDISLYLKMMHPELKTLYFIGLFQPQGCIWPLADLQAKIAAQIISGAISRPNDIPSKIIKETKLAQRRFKRSLRHALEVDYHDFRKQLLKQL